MHVVEEIVKYKNQKLNKILLAQFIFWTNIPLFKMQINKNHLK